MVALMFGFGLFRMPPIDVPGHLLLGQLIWEDGFVTTNLLSWTYPDNPMEQQYPLHQVTVHLLREGLGWTALSVYCAVTWTLAVGAWMVWAGGWSRVAPVFGVWLFGVIGVQRHLVPRPEVFTLLGLALLLVAFDHWRARPGWRPLAAMVATLWMMVNTHQLYVLGVALVLGFVIHVAVTRWTRDQLPIDGTDGDLPLAPLGATLAAGIGVLALSPLGIRAWTAPLALVSTVRELGGGEAQSAELAPVWTDPLATGVIVVLTVMVVFTGARAWGRWRYLELGVLAIGVVLVLVALRGIPFFAVAAAAVVTRWRTEAGPIRSLPSDSPVHVAWAATVILAVFGVANLAIVPRDPVYLKRQPGLGRSIGEWADHAVAFLREHPPPGEMINVGWASANHLWRLYPEQRVFVDGRWEAFPKDFLLESLAMPRDQDVLDRLIAKWDPTYAVIEMRSPYQQDRLATLVSRGWTLVWVDTLLAVAVRPTSTTEAYAAEHGFGPSAIAPVDWLVDEPVLHAQQQVRVAGLLERLGEVDRAGLLRDEARQLDHPAVARDLERFAVDR